MVIATLRCLLWGTLTAVVAAACSPTTPLQPTATPEIGVSPSVSPTRDVAPPQAASSATPEATAVTSSPQPTATGPAESPSTTRLAVVDQTSTVDTSRAGWWSIQTLGPVGQTFKPSFAGLDAIELWTEDQWDDDCSGKDATLQVNVREAAIDGQLIASSSPLRLTDCFSGIALFGFPSLVVLTPDQVYALEVLILSPDNWGVVWQQDPDSYPRGESIVLGTAGGADISFQVGLRKSIPLTEAYCQNNLWRHVKRADGSAFRDQQDCTQFVNTAN